MDERAPSEIDIAETSIRAGLHSSIQ